MIISPPSSNQFSTRRWNGHNEWIRLHNPLVYENVFTRNTYTCHEPPTCIYISYHLPVVPHKAVEEVSKKGTYMRGPLLFITAGKANRLMDRKVVGVVFLCRSGHLVGHPAHN